jgi:AraC family transcriptional regulator
MQTQTIHIRHMCCQRCIDVVESELTSIGLKVMSVTLGEATFVNANDVSSVIITGILEKRGFEMMFSEEERLVEAIKTTVIDLIHRSQSGRNKKIHIPTFIEKKMPKSFRQLNSIFLKHTHCTIEKYLILQRIEKVKELIEEGNNNFTEIADLIGYKTLPHLSGQFKKVVGISMLEYKMKNARQRIPIDKI